LGGGDNEKIKDWGYQMHTHRNILKGEERGAKGAAQEYYLSGPENTIRTINQEIALMTLDKIIIRGCILQIQFN